MAFNSNKWVLWVLHSVLLFSCQRSEKTGEESIGTKIFVFSSEELQSMAFWALNDVLESTEI